MQTNRPINLTKVKDGLLQAYEVQRFSLEPIGADQQGLHSAQYTYRLVLEDAADLLLA